MNPKTRNLIIGVVLLCVVGLIIVLVKSAGGGATAAPGAAEESTPGAPSTPATATQQGTVPTAVEDTPSFPSTTTASDTPVFTSGATSTPAEGEKAAAAVGQEEYIAYRSTQGECDQAVESGELESCVSPDSIQLITQPEWEQLFPDTDFYLIGLAGRNQNELYDHSYRHRLVAWQKGQYYTTETFDDLLKVNGINTITDENRELVARALVLMTRKMPDRIEKEVSFRDWREGDWPASFGFRYNYSIVVWTEIQGLEFWWRFIFEDGRLREAEGSILEAGVGDYIDVPEETLPIPGIVPEIYSFWGD